MSKNIKIEAIGPALEVGTRLHWDEESQVLYYVDVLKHTIHSYKPQTNEHHSVDVDCNGQPVSFIVRVKGEKNKFVISVKNTVASVEWDVVSSEPLKPVFIADLESKDNTTRINDGKCDPTNRLWAGTMSILKDEKFEHEKGSFYIMHHDKRVVKHLSNITISNGMAWSLDRKKFYYVDSLKYKVEGYDYNEANGTISNGKTVFCFKENKMEGFPDGMSMDAEGMLWVAVFNGAQVLRIDPTTGELKFTLKLPSYQITSVCFAGPKLEDLYVASAKINFTKELEKKYPLAGKTFKVTGLGVKGTLSMPIKL